MKSTVFLIASMILLMSCQVGAQNGDPFTGTFVDQQNSTALVLNADGSNYQGVISSGYVSFNLTAQKVGEQLQGQIHSGVGTSVPWTAQINGNQLFFSSSGATTTFFRMAHNGQNTGNTGYNGGSAQYPGYPQQQPQQGNTSYQNQGGASVSGPEASKIAGSRLYWFRKASVLATGGGAYGEIDFCSNGTFKDYSESSVTVEGGSRDYNTGQNSAWAGGASWERGSGRWTITNVQGQRSLVLQYNNGNNVTYQINNVMSGSWYIGRVKYAMDWGKGQCQ